MPLEEPQRAQAPRASEHVQCYYAMQLIEFAATTLLLGIWLHTQPLPPAWPLDAQSILNLRWHTVQAVKTEIAPHHVISSV